LVDPLPQRQPATRPGDGCAEGVTGIDGTSRALLLMRRALVLAVLMSGFLLGAALLTSTARADTVGDLVEAVAGND